MMSDSESPVRETEEDFNPIKGVKQPPPLAPKKKFVTFSYNYLAQSFEDAVEIVNEEKQNIGKEAVAVH